MKKTFLFGAAALLAGCACVGSECNKNAETAAANNSVIQSVPAVMPCTSACEQPNCMGKTEPVVLKPRVLEKVQDKSRRPCCADVEVITGEDQYYVPDAPEIYVISANRTINSMQTEAAAFFKQIGAIKVYIDKTERKSDDLPGGTDKGVETIKSRLEQMNKVKVVKDKKDADYIIGSQVDWYDTATKTVPAIKYDLFLNAPDGMTVGEWSEIIHQAEGDRSWW